MRIVQRHHRQEDSRGEESAAAWNLQKMSPAAAEKFETRISKSETKSKHENKKSKLPIPSVFE
jgi:hypothetical protein